MAIAADRNTEIEREILRCLFPCTEPACIFRRNGGPGIFRSKSAAALRALQRLADRGHIELSYGPEGELQGRLTLPGRQWLLEQENPRTLLEDLLRTIETQNERLEEMSGRLQEMRQSLAAQSSAVRETLLSLSEERQRLRAEELLVDAMSGTLKDEVWRRRTLAELFERLRAQHPSLTIGGFHDVVRTLHSQGRIRLSPWTGPLYQLPHPAAAILIGHEVLYYVELQPRLAA